METRLYVGNISHNVTEEQLRRMFSEAGTVTACEVIVDRQTGEPKGFAFLTMVSLEEAERAIALFNGINSDDRPLRVEFAKTQEEPGRIYNEAEGVRSTGVEVGRTNNDLDDLPDDTVEDEEIGRVNNEEPGIRTKEQEIGVINNEKDED